MSETPTAAPSSVRRFFAAMLILVGGLMAVLCGLCTAVFFIGGVASPGGGDPMSGMDVAILSLFLGGIPTLIGVGLIFGGRALLKPPRASP